MSSLTIENMSTAEKLQAMEDLWVSLSQNEAELDSPAWHAKALSQTEMRFNAGQEQPVEWTDAKEKLRQSNK